MTKGEAQKGDAEHEVSPTLTGAYFRVHEPCNARCQMCGFWTAVGGPRLEPDLILRVWDDLASLGAYRMVATGGEPLLYEPLAEIAGALAARVPGFRLAVITNGSVQGPNLERLTNLACLETVHVSLDGLSDEVMRTVRGREGWFTRGLQTAALIKQRNPAVRIVINAILNRYNIGLLRGYFELGNDVDFVNFIRLKGQFAMSPDREAEQKALHEIARLIREGETDRIFVSGNRRLDGARMVTESEAIWGDRDDRVPCVITSRTTYIDAQGFVFPCNCLAHEDRIPPFGNVKQDRFLEVWNSAPYRAFRSECLSTRWRTCRTCDPTNRMENIAASLPVGNRG